jgi:phosphatidate phosphatase APP1
LEALPTNVLNIAPYANWTKSGWNVRFHGNIYKQPNISVSTLNDLADVFLVNTSISDLPESQQAQARNLTAGIFVVQQPDVAVDKIRLKPAESEGSSGQAGGGGSSNTTGGTQDVTLPYNTTAQGDFDTFVQIDSNGLTAGNETSAIQRLDTHVEGASIGNATAYLVPPTGLTILSDIDDLLRVTKIYQPAQGLLNSFARPFKPWENMPEIYRNWSTSLPDAHFHYLVCPLCSLSY